METPTPSILLHAIHVSLSHLTANNIQFSSSHALPYHAIPSIIAVNMILAGASGGIVAISIAVWAQVRLSTMHLTSFNVIFAYAS